MTMKTNEVSKTRRGRILGLIEDAVSDLLYYDRKEDEDVPRGDIEAAIRAREISVTEIVDEFRHQFIAGLK